MKQKEIYYDLDWADAAPEVGRYLVSVGKRGINSIWLITGVRKVQHKAVRQYQRYYLAVEPAQEMKPYAVHDQESNEMWVRGEAAYPLCWYPRD